MNRAATLTNPQPITNPSRLPRFRRVPEPPHFVMTERDKRILQAVHEYRMLTRAQIEQLLFAPEGGQDHFTKTSVARHRLKMLYQNQYLERVVLSVGSASWAWQPVYRLACRGAEMVAADVGVNVQDLPYWGEGDDKDRRTTQVTPRAAQAPGSERVCASQRRGEPDGGSDSRFVFCLESR